MTTTRRTVPVALLLLATLAWLGGCSRTDTISLPGDDGALFTDVAFGDSATCDVVTWNLHNFPARGTVSVEAVAAAVEVMAPDILALQEVVGATSFQRVLDRLPDYGGYRATGAPYDQNLAFVYDTRTVTVDTIYEILVHEDALPRTPLVLEGAWRGHALVVIDNHFKCCGDGDLDETDPWDEETRRRDASNLLHDYIDAHWPDRAVILLGDLNDSLVDPAPDNVFQVFLDDPDHYRFTDMGIAAGSRLYWSWRQQSHLDHILVTDELFADVDTTVTIQLDDHYRGDYVADVSDHLPVGVRLSFAP